MELEWEKIRMELGMEYKMGKNKLYNCMQMILW